MPTRTLKHYGLYLDPELVEDQLLITYLDRYSRSRRIGEILRHALQSYLGSKPGVPAAPLNLPLPTQSATQGTGYLAPPSAATTSAADKVKRAFFK